MEHLVRHLICQNLDKIVAQSLLDCHVRGLDSIMLLDSPEQRIRLFVARPEHLLYQNSVTGLGSLSAHAHHCDVTLHVIHGTIINLNYDFNIPGRDRVYDAYRYQSAITHGTGCFERLHQTPGVFLDDFEVVAAEESVFLPAHQIHSVHVKQGTVAAWFVYEGREDSGYKPISYSDHDLTKDSFDGMYRRPTAEQVKEILNNLQADWL